MSWFNDFRKFTLRGNLVDLAVGFTVGAAFTTVAKSIVNDIIMPPVGLLLGSSDFSDMFWVLDKGTEAAPPYATLEAAQSAGAVTMNYGLFINNLIAFLMVALVMFFVIRSVQRVEDRMEDEFGEDRAKSEEPSHKKCPYCRTMIPYKAIRCPQCTSDLESRRATEGTPG